MMSAVYLDSASADWFRAPDNSSGSGRSNAARRIVPSCSSFYPRVASTSERNTAYIDGAVRGLGLAAVATLPSPTCSRLCLRHRSLPRSTFHRMQQRSARVQRKPRQGDTRMCSSGVNGLSGDDVFSWPLRDEASPDGTGAGDDNNAECESAIVEGLSLTRRELDAEMGARVRTVRLRRTSSLAEIGVSDLGDGSRKVSVHLAVQPARGDFRVIGRVATRVLRECDRCLNDFEAPSDGRFELLLSTSVGGLTEEEELDHEAIAEFYGARAEVDLAPHVRDAVYLSMPTKALCSSDCAGIVFVEPPHRIRKGSMGMERVLEGSGTDLLPSPRASENDTASERGECAGSVEAPGVLPEDPPSEISLLALKHKFEEHNNNRGKGRL